MAATSPLLSWATLPKSNTVNIVSVMIISFCQTFDSQSNHSQSNLSWHGKTMFTRFITHTEFVLLLSDLIFNTLVMLCWWWWLWCCCLYRPRQQHRGVALPITIFKYVLFALKLLLQLSCCLILINIYFELLWFCTIVADQEEGEEDVPRTAASSKKNSDKRLVSLSVVFTFYPVMLVDEMIHLTEYHHFNAGYSNKFIRRLIKHVLTIVIYSGKNYWTSVFNSMLLVTVLTAFEIVRLIAMKPWLISNLNLHKLIQRNECLDGKTLAFNLKIFIHNSSVQFVFGMTLVLFCSFANGPFVGNPQNYLIIYSVGNSIGTIYSMLFQPDHCLTAPTIAAAITTPPPTVLSLVTVKIDNSNHHHHHHRYRQGSGCSKSSGCSGGSNGSNKKNIFIFENQNRDELRGDAAAVVRPRRGCCGKRVFLISCKCSQDWWVWTWLFFFHFIQIGSLGVAATLILTNADGGRLKWVFYLQVMLFGFIATYTGSGQTKYDLSPEASRYKTSAKIIGTTATVLFYYLSRWENFL